MATRRTCKECNISYSYDGSSCADCRANRAEGGRLRCSKCGRQGPDVRNLSGEPLCDFCAEGPRRSPWAGSSKEFWVNVGRYSARPVLSCEGCDGAIESSEEYYALAPASGPILERRVKCVPCYTEINYTADDMRRELERTGADRWRMTRRRGPTSVKCERPNCAHYINAGDNYWVTVAGSVENPIRICHCKRHTAANGIDHDVNMPREAPAGKIGSRRVGLLPEH